MLMSTNVNKSPHGKHGICVTHVHVITLVYPQPNTNSWIEFFWGRAGGNEARPRDVWGRVLHRKLTDAGIFIRTVLNEESLGARCGTASKDEISLSGLEQQGKELGESPLGSKEPGANHKDTPYVGRR